MNRPRVFLLFVELLLTYFSKKFHFQREKKKFKSELWEINRFLLKRSNILCKKAPIFENICFFLPLLIRFSSFFRVSYVFDLSFTQPWMALGLTPLEFYACAINMALRLQPPQLQLTFIQVYTIYYRDFIIFVIENCTKFDLLPECFFKNQNKTNAKLLQFEKSKVLEKSLNASLSGLVRIRLLIYSLLEFP